MKNVLILINESSGAVRTLGVKEALTGLAEFIPDMPDVTIANGHPGKLIEAAKKATKESRIDTIITLGGDGTLAAIAGIITNHEISLLPLPGGTMNAFAQDLRFSPDLRTAIAQIPDLEERSVDIAFINEFAFLNNIVFGTYTAVADSREQLRDAEGFVETIDSVTEILGALTHTEIENYQLMVDGTQRNAQTNTIMVANNIYTGAEALRPVRASLSQGDLGLYVASAASTLDFITALTDAVTGNLADSSMIDVGTCKELRIDNESGFLSVTIDGEAMELPAPVYVEIRPKALRVLAPKAVD
ncbi:diacylglycerol kinase family protein [Hyphococcus formosus]|uniref:diacylglycerol/lipid kinase family protein n=1 Tax=Hyphococcus formosus TaxID=3143534 RepID=UPI00398ADF61